MTPGQVRKAWTGAWRQDTGATAVRGLDEIVDLGAVDVRRLFANIATASTTLGVDDGELTHVLVHRWSGEPASVNIYIGNTFGESGYLRTTLAGDMIRAYPYES